VAGAHGRGILIHAASHDRFLCTSTLFRERPVSWRGKRVKSSYNQLMDQTLWYKDAVFYELSVRAFKDSDGDGNGDLRGLTEKLDYLQTTILQKLSAHWMTSRH